MLYADQQVIIFLNLQGGPHITLAICATILLIFIIWCQLTAL